MKDKLVDMSIDPSTIKGKEAEVTATPKSQKVKKERKAASHYPSHHKGHGKLSNTVCVSNGKEIQKVLREDAELLVASGWKYAKKSEFRATKKAETVVPQQLTEITKKPRKQKEPKGT